MSEVQTMTVQRLSLFTVSKLFFLGTSLSFVIILSVLGVIGIFGVGPLSHSPHPLTGMGALIFLFFVPLLAPLAAVVSGLGHWAAMAVGLWIYSQYRPVTIAFKVESERLGQEDSRR